MYAEQGVFRVEPGPQRRPLFWLDNLYVRIASYYPVIDQEIVYAPEWAVWISRLTIQGDQALQPAPELGPGRSLLRFNRGTDILLQGAVRSLASQLMRSWSRIKAVLGAGVLIATATHVRYIAMHCRLKAGSAANA